MTKSGFKTILGLVMSMVNVHEAKPQLSRLLERVHTGEEFVIAKAGKPCARLMPLERVLGRHRDRDGDVAALDSALWEYASGTGGVHSNGSWCVKSRVATTSRQEDDLGVVVADLDVWLDEVWR